MELVIADVNLKMPYQAFETAINDCKDNYSYSMNIDIKPVQTRKGKSMYKIITDNGNGDEFTLVTEKDDVSGDVIIHPFKLQSMNESFYTSNYNNPDIKGEAEDPGVFLMYALCELCEKNHGTVAYMTPSGYTNIVNNGKRQRVTSIALVDSNGTIYSCAGAKTIKGETETADFSVNKPIGEWIKENPDVGRAINSLPLDQKMNYIGKYLIQQRVNEEIDSDEFMDIFRQAGIFGFSDKSVLHIYKLIM